ncbi:fucosyl transferase [Dictyocaulus viviparus]|uniref:Fucosyltransferase n=1 Tax=Dictyocaulus viviparus TaxID=29172 RepID=A0A0D8XKC6_DICVI|nr:fucosyl transferase [Dictyocaulus viviparus]
MRRRILKRSDILSMMIISAAISMGVTIIVFVVYRVEQQTSTTIQPQVIPVIVAWTGFFSDSLKTPLLKTLENCPLKCDFIDRTEQKLYNLSASAYVFHGRDMNVADLPAQHSNHLNVLMLMESPYHTGSAIHQVPSNYFNATITYRTDSRYFHPYGRFVPRSENDKTDDIITDEQLSAAVHKKTKGSLIFISNCNTPSKREHLIRKLMKVTPVTIRGQCEKIFDNNDDTKSSLCQDDCDDDSLIANHRFYLSFENSICNDYVTEKFFLRISQILLPIVIKRKIYEDANIPHKSFIALDDFNSMEELGDYLNVLRINDTAYLK